MNLEEFKVATKDQIKEYGDKIPFGYQYDNNNNKLTYKTSYGYWVVYTYDENNNKLTFRNSNSKWNEYTYNKNNNILTHKNVDKFWSEYTYDENNNELTYKDSDEIDCIFIIKADNYLLWFDIIENNYMLWFNTVTSNHHIGMKHLSYNECIKYFNTHRTSNIDSKLFIKTIDEHHKTVV